VTAPLDARELDVLESLGRVNPGSAVVMTAEFGEVLRRANALLEHYERIEPAEARNVWAAAFREHARDRRFDVASDNELALARDHADRVLGMFLERFARKL
jgi:hypothetical protein